MIHRGNRTTPWLCPALCQALRAEVGDHFWYGDWFDNVISISVPHELMSWKREGTQSGYELKNYYLIYRCIINAFRIINNAACHL